MIHIAKVKTYTLIFSLTITALITINSLTPFAQSTHPRLYYTPEIIDTFKQRILHDAEKNEAWLKILKRANDLVNKELVSLSYAESGSGQHGNYGRPSNQIKDMGATLGLAYQMTGEKQYAEKLRQALLHFIKLNRWAGDAKRNPPWHSELNTARFCFGYAIGYDSIHDYLSKSDRTTIVNGMVRLGILPTLDDWVLPEKRIHALDSMGHNWWSVCVAMAGTASLSIMETEPRAEEWVMQIRDAFEEWFAYQGNVLQNKSPNFDSKGAFYESVNYANYALYEYLVFHLACNNVFSDSFLCDNPLLNKVGDFFIHTAYPTSDSILSVNFGDSSLKASGASTLHYLHTIGINSPSYQWYLTRNNWRLNSPVGLVYHNLDQKNNPPRDLPNSMLYSDIGWSMMRNNWDNDATLLAVKSGFAWNHAHPDAGSFILFHNGKPLIIDSGNCSYSRREYTSYYRHSKAHNVVLFDGQAQLPEDCGNGGDRGVVHPGEVLHMMDLDGIKYALADATGPTSWKCSRNYRHFLWIDDVILIIDDIRTHKPETLEWLLHYQGEARENNGNIILSNGPESKAVVIPLYPKDMRILKKKGLKDHDPDTEVEYLAFSPREKNRSMKFITAILPLEKSGSAPDIDLQLLEGDEMLGVRMTHGDKITEVFLNLQADGRKMHRNSNNIIQGWDTDAFLFGTTRSTQAPDTPDAIERGFIICGSYLRKNNISLLDSLSKVYSVFSKHSGELDVILQGQPIINCEIRSKDKPTSNTLNHEASNPVWNEKKRTVKFRAVENVQ